MQRKRPFCMVESGTGANPRLTSPNMNVPLASLVRHQRHIHAPVDQSVGAAIGSMPARSAFLIRIKTSATISASSAIPAETRYPRPNP